MDYLQNKDLGYQKEQVVVVPTNMPRVRGMEIAGLYRNELLKQPQVAGASVSLMSFSETPWINVGYTDDKNIYRSFQFNAVDPYFLKTMGIQLKEGRDFSPANPADNMSSMIVNEALLKLFGWKKDEVINKYLAETIVPPQFREAHQKGLRRYVQTGESTILGKTIELFAVKKDNSEIDVSLSISPMKIGEELFFIGFIRDITEKKFLENKLKTFNESLSEQVKEQTSEITEARILADKLIDSLPGVFYFYDENGKFIRWNKTFEEVTGYSGEEIAQMHPTHFFADDEKALLAEKIANTFIIGEDNVQASFLNKSRKKIPYYFTGKVIEYGGALCLMGVGIDFSERIEAQETIKATSDQLRQLTAHLQSIREEERRRIGREIHDELGQQLTAIKMDVAWIDKQIPGENALVKSKLKNVITLLDGGNQSVRRILQELRPVVLQDYGLLETMKWQGRQFTESTGIPLEFKTTETQFKYTDEIATCIFRVYQEALTNITRYAAANKVLVVLTITGGRLMLTIEDDGKGFPTTGFAQKKSFGILGMKERVLSVNGDFDLVTAPGKGTKISISIPIEN